MKGLILQKGSGSKTAIQIPLLSITTAPSGTFAVGSKYYNSTDALIYTAVTANTWDGATTAAPSVIPTYYLFDGATYYWDGNSLEKTDTSAYEVKSNKTNSFISSSETTYPSSKGLSDGLATKAGQDVIEELKTNGIIGTTQYGGTITDDWNAIIKDGFYTSYGTATGVPSAIYSWFGIHQNSNVGTASATQRLIAYNSSELIVYERVKMSNVWGSWFSAGGGGAPTIAYFDVLAEATTINTGVDLSAKTVKVYFNGLLQRPNVGETDYDYEITTTEGVSSVVFNTAFTAAAVICVEYI